ncbi:MAG: hypothetical protein IKP10_01945 [Clostridia bacterium]|nr:hypothetical protein [Clostridia bacterium]
MKKTYEAPKVERLDFDYSNTVAASGLTDAATTAWWKCETRVKDVKSIDGTVCGYI